MIVEIILLILKLNERNKKNLDFLKIIIKKPQITFFLLIIFLIMLLYLHIF